MDDRTCPATRPAVFTYGARVTVTFIPANGAPPEHHFGVLAPDGWPVSYWGGPDSPDAPAEYPTAAGAMTAARVAAKKVGPHHRLTLHGAAVIERPLTDSGVALALAAVAATARARAYATAADYIVGGRRRANGKRTASRTSIAKRLWYWSRQTTRRAGRAWNKVNAQTPTRRFSK